MDIACPADCAWLKAARVHPPAFQQRQQEQDASLIVPLIEGLDDEAYSVLMACLPAALQFRGASQPAPLDDDLLAAAASLASTAETASRGVLYEHRPDSMVAARLARAMSAPLATAAEAGMPRLEMATVAAMRRLEGTLARFRKGGPGKPDAFFDFLARVLQPRLADANTGQALPPDADPLLAPLASAADGSRIIIP